VNYDSLVSTLPLAELLKKMPDLPPEIESLKKRLLWTSVLCVNLGVERAKISDQSWIYFPEKKFPFYRVGFPMNFTPHVVPKGCSSMYVEVGYPPEKIPDFKNPKFLKSIRSGLETAKILKKSDKILVADFIPIRYAYVIYTPERKAQMKTLFNFLNTHSIRSIGRYGAWKYSFMEEALLDGKMTAELIGKIS
jgi:protoporphyrinogen oxidase